MARKARKSRASRSERHERAARHESRKRSTPNTQVQGQSEAESRQRPGLPQEGQN